MSMLRGLMMGAVAVVAAVVFSGCARTVDFTGHGAYPSKTRYSDTLVIVVPDDLDTLKYRVQIGGWPVPRKFDVYYGQALRHEAQARFSEMFSEVAIIDETTFEKATSEEPGIANEFFLNDEEKAEAEKKSEKELEKEKFELEFLPEFIREERGYILYIREPRYRFEEARSLVLMDVEFRDRFLDQVLTQGRIRGRGANVSPRESDALIRTGLRESASTAFSEAMRRVREQMIATIEDPSVIGALPPEGTLIRVAAE
ncbi:MAG: hypothetical protein PWP23_1426 [Candidatus Sumerlaeota bacterium]|nr:hypothetical protein [Candidatus Sumerlaeota bacterium]